MTDIEIKTLVVEEDRPTHIAKHKVTVREVLEIVSGDYIYVEGKHDRWQLIGKTKQARFLAVIVGKRSAKNTYGLITARPTSRKERRFYKEFLKQRGGEKDENSNKN